MKHRYAQYHNDHQGIFFLDTHTNTTYDTGDVVRAIKSSGSHTILSEKTFKILSFSTTLPSLNESLIKGNQGYGYDVVYVKIAVGEEIDNKLQQVRWVYLDQLMLDKLADEPVYNTRSYTSQYLLIGN